MKMAVETYIKITDAIVVLAATLSIIKYVLLEDAHMLEILAGIIGGSATLFLMYSKFSK